MLMIHIMALPYNWHAEDAVLGADRQALEDWIDGEHRGDFLPLMRGRRRGGVTTNHYGANN
jgi:hypothetical protein